MIQWLNQNVYQNPRSLIPSLGLVTTGSLALLSGVPFIAAGIIALSASGVSYLFVRAVQRVNVLLDTLSGTLEAAKKAAEDVDELKREILKDGKIDKIKNIEKNILDATVLLKMALNEVVEKNPQTNKNKIEQISQLVEKIDSMVDNVEKNKNIEKFTEMEINLIGVTKDLKTLMQEIVEKNPTTQKSQVDEMKDIVHKMGVAFDKINTIVKDIADKNPETQKSRVEEIGDILHKVNTTLDQFTDGKMGEIQNEIKDAAKRINTITKNITDKNPETEKSKVDDLVGIVDKLNGILDALREGGKVEKLGIIEQRAMETITNMNGAIEDIRTGGLTFLMRGNGRNAQATTNAPAGQNEDPNKNAKGFFNWG